MNLYWKMAALAYDKMLENEKENAFRPWKRMFQCENSAFRRCGEVILRYNISTQWPDPEQRTTARAAGPSGLQ